MQSVCEERGRLQLHTGGKKAKAAQLQLPPQFRLAEKSPVKKEEQRRVCEEGLKQRAHFGGHSSHNTRHRIMF